MVKNNNEFTDILRKAGFRVTPTRLLVLVLLQQAKKPISPQDIIERVHSKADQATIYRILNAFKRIGIIRQIDFRHNHPHYELADVKDHHHVICAVCGYSEEITGCYVQAMQRVALRQAKKFTEIKEHSLEFYGVCAACKQ